MGANLLIHLIFIIVKTVREIRKECQRKCCKKVDAGGEGGKKELSVIMEDEFESNFSS